MDTKKTPGDEVVIQCLDKIELLERLLAKAWDGKLCNRLTEEEDEVLDGFLDRGRMRCRNGIMFRVKGKPAGPYFTSAANPQLY